MCETKTVLVSVWLILLAAASFCIYHAHTQNEVGHHSKIKVKVLGKASKKINAWIAAKAIIYMTEIL